MTTEKHAKTPAPAGQDKTARVGMWVSLSAAAVATVGILILAFYTHHQDQQSLVVAEPVPAAASEAAPSVIPVSEAQAASIAAATSDEQSKGMTAPSDVETVVAPETAPASAIASAPAAPLAADPAQAILANEHAVRAETQVVATGNSVQFYFAKGKADMAANTLTVLQAVVEGVKAGKKAVIVSYADDESNANLTKERASAVRTVLLAAGVPESSIEIKDPVTAADRDGRRVEVVLQ
ncbi:OmpA family protein [Conchiformibius kuhniae]|uniref:OmpA family protein n=1 Tax=Conchiformibius kuhniae TaxID=211502 RepID=A0A8T9MZE6_9NEIS|nr:OmpA family protein [Conchiformibius kuhniae]UOP05572.1 OmpA family protein [Conchiformibius kuhniae]